MVNRGVPASVADKDEGRLSDCSRHLPVLVAARLLWQLPDPTGRDRVHGIVRVRAMRPARPASRTIAPVTAEVRDLPGVDGTGRSSGSSSAERRRQASAASAVVGDSTDRRGRRGGSRRIAARRRARVDGADIVEGIAALEGWGRLAKALVDCSGVVPTVLVVDGPAVSGPALLLGVADLVVMTEASYAFVNGPVMVEEFTGVRITPTSSVAPPSWPATPACRASWSPTARRPSSRADLLAYLPSSVDEEPPRWPTDDPHRPVVPGGRGADPADVDRQLRRAAGRRAIVDADSLLEIRERWAANVVTAFATIGGRPIGIVANQPLALAGTLDIPASQKAARFVAFCDAFNLPLLTLVDTPGFYPGKDLEWRGMIRHGAQLVFAYARATVPRICVILRKSYGGAYIVMDSKRDGQRRLPRLAVGRAGRDGRRAGGGHPPAAGDARGAGGLRGRLRRAPAQPVRRRRARLRRCRHRPGGHPPEIAAALGAWPTSASAWRPQARQRAAC